jgi:hypothetical protein
MTQDHRTEAACLLEQGASYRRRIGLKPVGVTGDPIFAGFKQGAFSLYFGDAPIYHFDLEGRWQRAYVENVHYLKGLDAEIHAIDRVREGPNLVLKRRTLAPSEAGELDEQVRATAIDLISGLIAGKFDRVEPASPKAQPMTATELGECLERIRSWDSAAWLAHRERYRQTYGPLPFLPPECQNAVVLQATLGCGNGGGFGSSAAAGQASSRSISEFAQHVDDVAALWGQRLLQSHLLFLAGSDVLHQPVERVADLLRLIGERFPIEPKTRGARPDRSADDEKLRFDGVHVFLEDFAVRPPSRAGWRGLVERGLIRISLGVESGDPGVRSIYRKTWEDDALRSTVADIKAAGLGISVLTLVGAGGVERAQPHVERTARVIDSLELGAGDFVFLLDENEIRDQNSVTEGMTFLRGQAWSEQQAALKEALAPLRKKGVKVLPYTLEKQWA